MPPVTFTDRSFTSQQAYGETARKVRRRPNDLESGKLAATRSNAGKTATTAGLATGEVQEVQSPAVLASKRGLATFTSAAMEDADNTSALVRHEMSEQFGVRDDTAAVLRLRGGAGGPWATTLGRVFDFAKQAGRGTTTAHIWSQADNEQFVEEMRQDTVRLPNGQHVGFFPGYTQALQGLKEVFAEPPANAPLTAADRKAIAAVRAKISPMIEENQHELDTLRNGTGSAQRFLRGATSLLLSAPPFVTSLLQQPKAFLYLSFATSAHLKTILLAVEKSLNKYTGSSAWRSHFIGRHLLWLGPSVLFLLPTFVPSIRAKFGQGFAPPPPPDASRLHKIFTGPNIWALGAGVIELMTFVGLDHGGKIKNKLFKGDLGKGRLQLPTNTDVYVRSLQQGYHGPAIPATRGSVERQLESMSVFIDKMDDHRKVFTASEETDLTLHDGSEVSGRGLHINNTLSAGVTSVRSGSTAIRGVIRNVLPQIEQAAEAAEAAGVDSSVAKKSGFAAVSTLFSVIQAGFTLNSLYTAADFVPFALYVIASMWLAALNPHTTEQDVNTLFQSLSSGTGIATPPTIHQFVNQRLNQTSVFEIDSAKKQYAGFVGWTLYLVASELLYAHYVGPVLGAGLSKGFNAAGKGLNVAGRGVGTGAGWIGDKTGVSAPMNRAFGAASRQMRSFGNLLSAGYKQMPWVTPVPEEIPLETLDGVLAREPMPILTEIGRLQDLAERSVGNFAAANQDAINQLDATDPAYLQTLRHMADAHLDRTDRTLPSMFHELFHQQVEAWGEQRANAAAGDGAADGGAADGLPDYARQPFPVGYADVQNGARAVVDANAGVLHGLDPSAPSYLSDVRSTAENHLNIIHAGASPLLREAVLDVVMEWAGEKASSAKKTPLNTLDPVLAGASEWPPLMKVEHANSHAVASVANFLRHNGEAILRLDPDDQPAFLSALGTMATEHLALGGRGLPQIFQALFQHHVEAWGRAALAADAAGHDIPDFDPDAYPLPLDHPLVDPHVKARDFVVTHQEELESLDPTHADYAGRLDGLIDDHIEANYSGASPAEKQAIKETLRAWGAANTAAASAEPRDFLSARAQNALGAIFGRLSAITVAGGSTRTAADAELDRTYQNTIKRLANQVGGEIVQLGKAARGRVPEAQVSALVAQALDDLQDALPPRLAAQTRPDLLGFITLLNKNPDEVGNIGRR